MAQWQWWRVIHWKGGSFKKKRSVKNILLWKTFKKRQHFLPNTLNSEKIPWWPPKCLGRSLKQHWTFQMNMNKKVISMNNWKWPPQVLLGLELAIQAVPIINQFEYFWEYFLSNFSFKQFNWEPLKWIG